MTRGLKRFAASERDGLQKELKDLGKRVAKRRVRNGMTQEALAEQVHVSVQMIAAVEQGRRIPSVPLLLKISKALGLYLLREK